MNERTGNMQQEARKPEHDKNHRYRLQHLFFSFNQERTGVFLTPVLSEHAKRACSGCQSRIIYLLAAASAFAPFTASRNVFACGVGGTWPSNTAFVETPAP
jgi:hypothetical protein